MNGDKKSPYAGGFLSAEHHCEIATPASRARNDHPAELIPKLKCWHSFNIRLHAKYAARLRILSQ
jgi:hypothetical protein